MTWVPLHAGPLSLVFQPDIGAVRHVLAAQHEILRGIGAPVRDHAWMTVPPAIGDLVIRQEAGAFHVRFRAQCDDGNVDFGWRGEIAGEPDGTLTFTFDGEARRGFQRNRIGFCVLHPADAAGARCTVEHVDGRVETATLPRDIAPHQPFHDVRAITHEFAPGLRAEVRMEGDVFEMEDQRNWTDASFKTYCTPLALPRPVPVERGTRIRQTVTLRLHGDVKRAPAGFLFPWDPPDTVRVSIGAPPGHPFPRLGVVWNAGPPTSALVAALRPLRLAHLRVDLALADESFRTELRHAAAAAAALDVAIEPAIFAEGVSEAAVLRLLDAFAALTPRPRIAQWLVFDLASPATPPELVELFRRLLAGTPFAAPIAGGATENFTELNRARAVAAVADATVHACNPQVHAFDEASMLETLAIQGLTVDNVRRISDGRPAIVSPVTLAPRWQPGATDAPPASPGRLMPFRADPRHATPFAAAWLLGSLASLAEHGAASVTFFETVGPSGILNSDSARLPVGEALRCVAPFIDSRVIATTMSHPLRVAAVAVSGQSTRALLVANLTDAVQRVNVDGAWGARSLSLGAYRWDVVEFQ